MTNHCYEGLGASIGGLNFELVVVRETVKIVFGRINDTKNDVHTTREDVREIWKTLEKNTKTISQNNKVIEANVLIVPLLCQLLKGPIRPSP